ncbi:MAG TPA: hypothetical protein VMK42_09385 [Anaeromyxobacteraceae bacterium]|nr:hypothetical protein [Anaeromyxobacteraceae bacterium]
MTSWSAPASQTRYYQCPFCGRTWCSAYGDLFKRGAGARLLDARRGSGVGVRGAAAQASAEDAGWRELKGRADRWFARLAREERRCAHHNGRRSPEPTVSYAVPPLRPGHAK